METVRLNLRRLKSWSEQSRSRSLELLLVCLGLALTASCGNSGNTAPSTPQSKRIESSGGKKSAASNKAPEVDACALVTRSEADAIMGKLREDPKRATTLGGEKACSYLNSDGA